MTSDAPIAPSGRQYELRHGEQRIVITEVGAGLRTYTVHGRHVVDGYAVDEMCTGGRGQILIPWPNRVDGGRYRFGDVEHVLPLTEPEAGNAIHGLTRWLPWWPAEHREDVVRLRCRLHAQPGWPFPLDCELSYRLDAGGLTVRTSATNVGQQPCPYATGAHPYLTAGTPAIDTAHVGVPAARYYPTDDLGIPIGQDPVDGTDYDLREPVAIGDRRLDVALTELTRDSDGLVRVRLTPPDGGSVTLWLDGAYGYLQLYTGDTLPEPRRRRSLAVEPMTAAPNALRTGDGLVTLRPGESHVAAWGITPRT